MAESLAYSKWVCKYHIVFTPKYKRKMIYDELREDIEDIKEIIKDLCKWKGIKIIEGHMMPDHVPHKAGDAIFRRYRQQQMHMVGHHMPLQYLHTLPFAQIPNILLYIHS